MPLITFNDKVDSKVSAVPDINKITASDINQLKDGVNANEASSAKYIDIEVTSAQILDLHNTPVELIPQPIDGSLSYPSKVYIKHIFGTTAYTQNGSTNINVRTSAYTDAVLGETFGSYTFSSAADYQKMTSIIQVGEQDAFSTELYTPAALIEGDGTIKVRVYYSDIPSTF
ncbi:hypothetical protein N9824_00435 [bacterium]|nr:hypothetical protein [bacterium]